jgi:hypothetical protein
MIIFSKIRNRSPAILNVKIARFVGIHQQKLGMQKGFQLFPCEDLIGVRYLGRIIAGIAWKAQHSDLVSIRKEISV